MSTGSQQIVTLQAVNSTTFKLPSGFLEAKLPLPVVWDYHLQHSAEHPLLVYEDGPDSLKTVTWSEGVKAVHRAARLVNSHVEKFDINGKDPNPLILGIVAHMDSVRFWAMITGIMRAGHTVFLISSRNSAPAVAHLLKVKSCSTVFASDDTITKELIQEVLKLCESEIRILPVPPLEDLFKSEESNFVPLPPFSEELLEQPAMIAHSSGSTSFPKPIVLTHRICARWAMFPYISDSDFCGRVLSLHAMPLFHVMGFSPSVHWATGTGLTISFFNPKKTPAVVNSKLVLDGALITKSNILIVVPLFLQEYCKSIETVKRLRRFDKVFWGGSTLSKGCGDLLIENGVNIGSYYGATEVGTMVSLPLKNPGVDWEWLELSVAKRIHLTPTGDGFTYELFVLDAEDNRICVTNTTIEGVPAYATNDLVIQHPTRRNLWTVFGRADDQIMHSTGEKTNPGPMEDIISRDPLVQACMVFGRNQYQTGILIQPIDSLKIDPNNDEEIAKFRNDVWSTIQEANAFAPRHSRIFKEMIIVADPAKPFMYTPKLSLKRQLMLQQYQEEISGLYQTVEATADNGVPLPPSWETPDCTNFIRDVVGKTLGQQLHDNDDIFLKGADSLQATYIRNAILRAFRAANQNTENIAQDLVYSHPTIFALGQVMSNLTQNSSSQTQSEETAVAAMESLVAEFSQNFPTHKPKIPIPELECVLVTGTTGSLGSCVLKELLDAPTVSRVYALNRPDKSRGLTVRQRQEQSFKDHGISPSLLNSNKLILLEGDSSEDNLGLAQNTFNKILTSITTIIHIAWKVDFNLKLQSFRPLVLGVRNLIDIALSSPLEKPPALLFVSSISAVTGWKGPSLVPEIPLKDAKLALGGGYGESKWVAEQILDAARKKTALNAVVIRFGQLCGGRSSGKWNPWEWFPSIVRSHRELGSLPLTRGEISWIPIDIAAKALVDMRASKTEVLHIVHPHPVPADSILRIIAKTLNVSQITYTEWLGKLESLEKSTKSADICPAYKLLDFYRKLRDTEAQLPEREAFLGTSLAVEQALGASKTLRELNVASSLSESDVRMWMVSWGEKGDL